MHTAVTRRPPLRPAPRGLYAAKPAFTRLLAPVEAALAARGVRPDTVTAAGVVAGWLAGACLAAGALLGLPPLWLAVGPLGLVRLAANALDGALARRTGLATPAGTLKNEVGDRLADVGLLAGVGAVAGPLAAALALAGALAASLAGVLALALTGRRDCGGPLGKSERVVVVGAGAGLAAATASPAPVLVAAGVVAAGGVLTALARTARLHRVLRAAAGSRPSDRAGDRP